MTWLVKGLTYIFSTKLLKAILFSTMEVLVKRTDNDLDDEIFEKVKEYLK